MCKDLRILLVQLLDYASKVLDSVRCILFRPCSAYLTLILLVLLVLLAIDKVVGEDTTQKK